MVIIFRALMFLNHNSKNFWKSHFYYTQYFGKIKENSEIFFYWNWCFRNPFLNSEIFHLLNFEFPKYREISENSYLSIACSFIQYSNPNEKSWLRFFFPKSNLFFFEMIYKKWIIFSILRLIILGMIFFSYQESIAIRSEFFNDTK